ncbi:MULTISPECIES: tetratricopeptide repeat protein [Henriciella]|uniref:Tetratricopeptide repeat protein n=1 Tax=Henriciella pelagia TaxID=1977912 RepID=A0ABQ1J040_9PROT|nr:hypothetical protein [Henriciella pelagia]GGB56875.1 hypothetical protein GCM10011503_01520 [Henriciella pelagia]
MTRQTLYLLVGAVIVAAGLYLVLGRPLLAEQPYADREAEIASRNPAALTPPEMLARLQMAARQDPDAPEPHHFIGVIMRAEGRTDDAIRAFQSALRRDDSHVPSLVALADQIMLRDGGVVTPASARLYDRAWRLDPRETRAGLLSALPAYAAGDVEAAEAHWAEIRKGMEPGDPLLGMLEAFKTQIDEANAEAGN